MNNPIRHLLCAAAVWISLPIAAHAQIIFSDNFDTGASPQWGNERGSWAAGAGVYNGSNTAGINFSSLPFALTNFALDVDINDVGDGGIWLRSDATGQNGILLVTGGNGWGSGDTSGGRSLYWHVIQSGSPVGTFNSVNPGFTPGVSDIHLRVTVVGNTYSAFLNGSSTAATTLTNTQFTSGRVGLYDKSSQSFDNVVVGAVPEPSTCALILIGLAAAAGRKQQRRQ